MEDPGPVLVLPGGECTADVAAALGERGLDATAASVTNLADELAGNRPGVLACLDGPDWSGLEQLAVVREVDASVPVVVVTGDDERAGTLASVAGSATSVAAVAATDGGWPAVDAAVPAIANGAAAAAGRGEPVSTGAGDREAGAAELRTEPDRRARRLSALHGSVRELVTAEDTTAVCEAAVDAAIEILDLPAVGIHLVSGDGLLEPVACSDTARELFDGVPPTYTPDDRLVWSVYASGEPRVIDDLAADDDIDRDSPVRSALVLPLGDHGVFISSGRDPREFDSESVDLARLLAANTEAALTRARNVGVLRERERELRALFETIPIPAVGVDHRDGEPIVREVNPAFEETFGYDAEELLGENLDDYVTPGHRLDETESITSRGAAGERLSQEVRRQTTDGLRDFLLTIAPVEPGVEGTRAYGFYIDITERQRRQQRLRVLSRVLRHDIRNQATIVRGTAELIADRTDDPTIERGAADVARAAEELAEIGLKTRIVERTQVDAGPGEADAAGRILEGVVAPIRTDHPDAAIEVDVPADAAVAAAEALGLALRELVENAVVHNDAGTPRVWIRGRTIAEGFLELEIADDGPGIPEDELAVLTGQREPTQLEHASGLGLWIAKWIVGGIGGEFDVRCRDAGGTVVELQVPLASARA